MFFYSKTQPKVHVLNMLKDVKTRMNDHDIYIYNCSVKAHARGVERRSSWRTVVRIFEGSQEFAHPVNMCFVKSEKVYIHVPWGIL